MLQSVHLAAPLVAMQSFPLPPMFPILATPKVASRVCVPRCTNCMLTLRLHDWLFFPFISFLWFSSSFLFVSCSPVEPFHFSLPLLYKPLRTLPAVTSKAGLRETASSCDGNAAAGAPGQDQQYIYIYIYIDIYIYIYIYICIYIYTHTYRELLCLHAIQRDLHSRFCVCVNRRGFVGCPFFMYTDVRLLYSFEWMVPGRFMYSFESMVPSCKILNRGMRTYAISLQVPRIRFLTSPATEQAATSLCYWKYFMRQSLFFLSACFYEINGAKGVFLSVSYCWKYLTC